MTRNGAMALLVAYAIGLAVLVAGAAPAGRALARYPLLARLRGAPSTAVAREWLARQNRRCAGSTVRVAWSTAGSVTYWTDCEVFDGPVHFACTRDARRAWRCSGFSGVLPVPAHPPR